MAYKLNKFATLCQEDDVVDIDINMEPTEGEEAEAVGAEIEANEAVAEIEEAADQADNAEIAADEVEERIEEGEAVIAVSEPAVDNGGEVPADFAVTTDSGKELTAEEVAEATEKLNEAGEVAPEVVVEQEAFIQRIELITGLKRRSPGIALESARRNSTDSYKLCQEGLKEIGASIKTFLKKIWKWIVDKFTEFKKFIVKYLPTKLGKARRLVEKLKDKKANTIEISKLPSVETIGFATIGVGLTETLKNIGVTGAKISEANNALMKDVEEATKVVKDGEKSAADRQAAVEKLKDIRTKSLSKKVADMSGKIDLPLIDVVAEINKKDDFKDKPVKDEDVVLTGCNVKSGTKDGKFIIEASALVNGEKGSNMVSVEAEVAVGAGTVSGEQVITALTNLIEASDKLSKLKDNVLNSSDKVIKAAERGANALDGVSDGAGSTNVLAKEFANYNKEIAKSTRNNMVAYIKLVNAASSRTLNAWNQIGAKLLG